MSLKPTEAAALAETTGGVTVALRAPATARVRPRVVFAGATTVLGLLALLHVATAVAAVADPAEIISAETLGYASVVRLAQGLAPYVPLNQAPFVPAIYGYSFYLLGAALYHLFGPGLGPLRAANVLLALLSAGLVAHLTVRRTQSRPAALFAASLFLALGFPGFVPWFGFYRSDLLGVALSLASLALLQRGSGRAVILAGLLAGTAFTVKLTFVGALAAGSIWLFARHRSSLGRFLLPALGGILVVDGWAQLTTSQFISNNTLGNAVPFSVPSLFLNLLLLILYQALPLGLAAAFVRGKRGWRATGAGDPVVLYWLVALLAIPEMAKEGGYLNYWIELAAASAVLTADLLWGSELSARRATQPAVALFLVLGLIVTGVGVAAEYSAPRLPSPPPGFFDVLSLVRTTPGDVISDPDDIAVLSGHRLLVEGYLVALLEQEGRWDSAPLLRQICSGDVRLLVLSYPLSQANAEDFPLDVIQALRATMTEEEDVGSYDVYRPNAAERAACPAAVSVHTGAT